MTSSRLSTRWRRWLRLAAVFWMLLMPFAADTRAHPDALPPDQTSTSEEPRQPQVTVVTSNVDELVLEVSIPPVEFREAVEDGVSYRRAYLPGAGATTEVGKPELPSFGYFFAVPTGATLQLEILDQSPALTSLATSETGPIYPAQPAQMEQGPTPPFELDAEFYQQDVFYPAQKATVDEMTSLRGIQVSVLRFFPVQFNPARGQVRAASRLRVRISFSGGSGQFVDRRLWSPYFESGYRQLLLNYPLLEAELEQAPPGQAPPGAAESIGIASPNGADLLILTHPSLLEPANTLASWKIRRGIDTEVRTTAQTGTTAHAIRDYILNAYTTWDIPPSFVLFLGDAEFLPPFYVTVHPWACQDCWYPEGTLVGTDLYYADMSGNYYPELAIGRIPVDTAAEAATVINKIIDYERTPPASPAFYSSAMVVAYFEDFNLDNYSDRRWVKTSEEIRDFLRSLGYAVNRVYYARSDVNPTHYNDGPYSNGEPLPAELLRPGFAWDGWTADIQSAINDGRFLVTHRDHGLSLNNEKSPLEGWQYPRFEATDAADLNNGSQLPVVFSMNCETGWFDGETDHNLAKSTQSLSEVLLLHPSGGAVGIISATRVSFTGYNDFMVRGYMDAIWPSFIPDWGADAPEYRLGQVLNIGKLSMVQFWGGTAGKQLVTFEDFHYFGDPTMEIWTGLPCQLSVSHPPALAYGATRLTVDVAQDDALVTLVQGGDIIAKATSSAGHASLNFAPIDSAPIEVTVTRHNCVPYQGLIQVGPGCYLPLILKNH